MTLWFKKEVQVVLEMLVLFGGLGSLLAQGVNGRILVHLLLCLLEGGYYLFKGI